MLTPEGRVKKALDDYLKAIGVKQVIKPATFGYGVSGNPDRIFAWRGRMVAIEVKREGKTPTPLQQRRLRELHQDGAVAIWGDSIAMIIEKLKTALGLP